MENKAKQIAFAIMEDILDRKGIGDEMEVVDDDVKLDILVTWERLIGSILKEDS